MTKVLVAGATGYLGKFVVREFKKQGYWVRALARNPKKLVETGPFLEPAVKVHVDNIFIGEVTKLETLCGLCDGIDIVFSSIGITRQRGKVGFMRVDYQGNKNILDIALQAAVEMIRPFSDKYYTLASFFAAVMHNDFDALKTGTYLLREYYEELALQL